MSLALPPLLSARRLQDACERTAKAERVAPEAVEKDYYLTRLLWALAQVSGSSLLLKGGTLLSKVDLGFRRMSEDVDLVIPWDHGRSRTYASINATVLGGIARTIRGFEREVGIHLPNVTGQRWAQDQGVIWDVTYESSYGPQGIQVEVSLQEVFREPRRASLCQLLPESLTPGYQHAFCFALAPDEARAEKVRAAFTRRAIRDYYDLRILLDEGFDLNSSSFTTLVDRKLAELKAPPLAEQPPRFGLTGAELVRLERDVDRDLTAVVRRDEPHFDLEETLRLFDRLWGKAGSPQPPEQPSVGAPGI